VSTVESYEKFLMPNYARFPVVFARGEGARLWDTDGNEYLDFLAGISVNNVGHCHPAVVEAIREQAGRLLHVGNLYYNEPMAALAQRLSESSLGGKVYFANSGAEAIEAAIKIARKANPGGTIVSLHGGFHGRTYGALSATPQESKQAPFAPLVPGFVSVAPTLEGLASAIGSDTAGVIIEPIQGESGVHLIDDTVLRGAAEMCSQHGTLLIFDEIQTGLGRTGDAWAYQRAGVRPALITTAKALGGGLPIGAVIAGGSVGDTFVPGDHGSTFAGGPVVCAAALAALDVLLDAELLARVRDLGELMRERLATLPHVTEIRGRGLMNAIDLAVDAPEIARRALLEQRLVVNATGPVTLRMLPPLLIGEDEVEDCVARLRAVLS
jgi:acetylornithine/N-succinyldiaminopimelate aminotransferase